MHHFQYRDSALFVEDVDVTALAGTVGTPFYVYSAATLRRHVRVLREALDGLPTLIAYAMKANSNQAVLKVIAGEGAGADVVSGGELERAIAAGIPANKIVFSGVGKTVAEMRRGLELGIKCFNLESEPELERLAEIAASMGKVAPVSVRINPDVSAGGHAKISTGKKDNKFGIPHARAREVYPAHRRAQGRRGGRHRHAYRQPDHRYGALRQRLSPARRARRLAARGWPPDQARRRWRRPWHPVSRRSRRAAFAGRICRDHQAASGQSWRRDRAGAGPAHRRQCRHPRHPRRICEGRRQDLRHRRCRDERSDPADALRSPSRDPAGAALEPAADHRRYRRPGLRNRRLHRARPQDAGRRARATCSR